MRVPVAISAGMVILAATVSPSARETQSLIDRLKALDAQHGGLCPQPRGSTQALDSFHDLEAQLRERLDSVTAPQARVEAMNRFVFDTLAIRSSQDLHDSCNLLLSDVLAHKQGYCVGIAALYLALSESADLPIFAVATPSHIFLRYDDGSTRINIETFQRGAAESDVQYVREQKIPAASIRKGVFMRNLTADEFLAQVYNNLGVIYSEKEDFARAAQEFEQAREMAPRCPAPLYNYANNFLRQGDAKTAVKLFTKSLRLYPTDVWALNNRGLAYVKMGKTEKARRDFEEALRIDPRFEPARTNLGRMAATSR